MTQFEIKVLKAVKKIPKGEVKTYKQIAREIGSPKSFRAVGNALNKNPFAPEIPCHRVVKSDYTLGGYAKGLKKKKTLLIKEGVKIEDNKVIK